ncbi:MAG: hypothetical protein ACRCZL_07945 [Cetobacterium sp.]
MELYINLEILEWTNNKELNKDISVVKRKEFMKEFLGVWKKAIGRKNRHSTNTFELIARIEENL